MTPSLDYGYLLAVYVAMAIVSFGERALPFVASRWLQRQSWVRTLGAFLPMAVMVLLTLHSATDAAVSRGVLPVAEVASIALVWVLQWMTKNALLSIFSGTGLYVAWVNGWIPGLGALF